MVNIDINIHLTLVSMMYVVNSKLLSEAGLLVCIH